MNQHLLREASDAALYREQRDELAEALRMALAYIETRDMRPLDLRVIRAALAKCHD